MTYPETVTRDGVTLGLWATGAVQWRSDCDYCVKHGAIGAFFPSHDASPGCRSGGRDHCTCDGCF